MKRKELITILLMDEVKDKMSQLGLTEVELPANKLHLTKVWLANDEDEYVNLCYNVEQGYDVTESDDVILTTILDNLPQPPMGT